MEQGHDERRIGTTARYRLGGNVHWIQARKAWEDPERWIPGVLLAIDGDTATVRFVDESDLAGGVPTEAQLGGAEDDGEMARGAFQIEEASLEGLPVGELVWVTERWGILAFADEDGNAFALRPASGMVGTIFVRSGAEQLRFLLARFVDEVAEPEEEPEEELDEFVYGVVTGLDGMEHFNALPRSIVEEVLEPIRVFNECSTWGEVRETSTPELYEELLGRAGYGTFEDYSQDLHVGRPIPGAIDVGRERYEELAERDLPSDDDAFDPGEIEGVVSLDFPPTFAYLQNVCLPDDLAGEYGRKSETIFNGTFLDIDPAEGPALVAELEELGYRCREDPGLLSGEIWRHEWMT